MKITFKSDLPTFGHIYRDHPGYHSACMSRADVVGLGPRPNALDPLQFACLQDYGIPAQLLEAHHRIPVVPVDLVHSCG